MAPLKQRNTARANRPLPKVSGAPMLLLAGAATVLWTAASSLLAPRLLPVPCAPKSQIPHWPFKSKAQRLYKNKAMPLQSDPETNHPRASIFARVKNHLQVLLWWWFASGTSLRIGKSCMQAKKQSHVDRELNRIVISPPGSIASCCPRNVQSVPLTRASAFVLRPEQSPVQYTLWKLHWKERCHSYQAPLPACCTTHLIVPLVPQASCLGFQPMPKPSKTS